MGDDEIGLAGSTMSLTLSEACCDMRGYRTNLVYWTGVSLML